MSTIKFDSLIAAYKVYAKLNATEIFEQVLREQISSAVNLSDENKDNTVERLYRTLVNDKVTRLNNVAKYYNGYLPDRDIRLAVVEHCKTALESFKSAPKKDKPDWQLDLEDLKEINDAEKLRKIGNSLSSAKSKEDMRSRAKELFGLDDDGIDARFNALRTFCTQRRKELESPAANISEALKGKLDKGTKVTLSKEEVEQLKALLK